MTDRLLSIVEAGNALGVSRSTIWRLIRRGELPSVLRSGRRLVPATALRTKTAQKQRQQIAPFRHDHPMFRLAGAGRGGGQQPGARDKHAILDR